VVVAVDFEGSDDPDSAVNKEAKKQCVTLIRTKDLIKLVILSAPKQIGLLDLESLFRDNHTVIETSQWIKQIEKKEVAKGPIKELLNAIFLLQKDDYEAVEISALRMTDVKLKGCSKEELRTLIQSLVRLIPGFISLEGEIVSLQVPPEKVMEAMNKVVTAVEIPPEFQQLYFKAFNID